MKHLFQPLCMALCLFSWALPGCTPRVEVMTDKPITVNLNVKIDHEIRVKVDKQVENLMTKDKEGIF